MSNIDDYNSLLDVLNGIEKKDIKSPRSIPVDVYIQEAEDLYSWCREDSELLAQSGLDTSFIISLPVRCGALREAQSKWINTFLQKKENREVWAAESPGAYVLRDKLLYHFRFAYRNHASLKTAVKAIAKGASHADMLQDLNDLAVMGKKNPTPLERINMDMNLLEKAASISDSLSNLLARARSEKKSLPMVTEMRNRAYTYLKEAVDQIREHGKYVFARDRNRKKGYRSEFLRRKNSKAQLESAKEQSEAFIE